jgi:hypothetical protein
MWSQLMVGLVLELGISRAPALDKPEFYYSFRWFPPRLTEQSIRSMEERRAVLGTFIITSMQVFPVLL